MNIAMYLHFTYNIITSDVPIGKNCLIYICCSHFASIIIKQIKSKISNCSKWKRDTIMIIVFLIIDCEKISDIDNFFRNLCIICCSLYKDSTFIKSYEILRNNIEHFVENEKLDFDEINIKECEPN